MALKYLLYIILAIIQFLAIITGFVEIFGGFFGFIIAVIIAPIPIIGEIIGMIGAIRNWGWSPISAVLLFWGLPIASYLYFKKKLRKENKIDKILTISKATSQGSEIIKEDIVPKIQISKDKIVSEESNQNLSTTEQKIIENEVNDKTSSKHTSVSDDNVFVEELKNLPNIEIKVDEGSIKIDKDISKYYGRWKNYNNIIEIKKDIILLENSNTNIIIKEVISKNNDYYKIVAEDIEKISKYYIELHFLEFAEIYILIKKNGIDYLSEIFKKSFFA